MTTLCNHVFIDIDDTLYDYEISNNEGLKAVFNFLSDYSGKSVSEISNLYDESRKFIKSNLSKTSSSHNKLLHFRKLTNLLQINISVEILSSINDLYWDSFFNNLTPTLGLESLFEYFSKNNFKIIFFTDYNLSFQLTKLKKLNLGSYHSTIISSEEVGADKPSINFKEYLSEYISNNISSSDKVFVIGNDDEKDINLIKSLIACKSFLVGNKNKKEKIYKNVDFIVQDLNEVIKQLT